MNFLSRKLYRGTVLSYVVVFVLGLVAWGSVHTLRQIFEAPCAETYDLLSPQLQCGENFVDRGEWAFEQLRDDLLVKKNDWKNAGIVNHISVYFRDLHAGPRFGIGEYDKFQPASLRKVPVMIAILHMADLDPGILDRTLTFSGDLKINPNVQSAEETIAPDTPYTVRELLRKMIVYSDNYSYTLLTGQLNESPPILSYYTFRDLGVLQMMIDPKGEFISIQNYASLFGILYNTGYLSKPLSQYALQLLSEATFHDGLVAGVPEGTRVAHKFGERFDDPGEGQLHDCGIIYHPATSYILCVMTTGTDMQKQGTAIAEVSRMVYTTVTSVYSTVADSGR